MEPAPRHYVNLTRPVQSTFLLLAISTIVLIAVLSPLIDAGTNDLIAYQELVKDTLKWSLMPDRRQKIVYLTATFLLPMAILLIAYCRTNSDISSRHNSKPSIDRISALVISFAFSLAIFESPLLSLFLNREFDISMAIIVTLISAALIYVTKKSSSKTSKNNGLFFSIYIACVITQILSFRIFSSKALTESTVWSESLDAVIYPLTEVHSGKTLIADLPSQYGLYAEFMAPLFHIIELNLLNITIVFALMQLVSMAALGIFVSRTIASFPIKYLVSISLIAATFSSIGHYFGAADAYFQYWPIRFFWPALVTLQFYYFSSDRTIGKAFAISISAALATIWNVDVGAVIFVTFLAYLVSRHLLILVPGKSGKGACDDWSAILYLKAIGIHISTIVVIASLALFYLELKSGTKIEVRDTLKYQNIFYGMGYMKLGIPIYPHPWMSIISIYFLGIIYSAMLWRSGMRTEKIDSIFFLSTLGLGIFSYYEGRSHIFNLATILWPNLILVGIFSDTVISRIKKNKLDKFMNIYPLIGLSFLTVFSMGLIFHTEIFLQSAIALPGRLTSPEHNIVQNEMDFIRKHSSRYKNCVILSQRQAIYYLETKTNSPLGGPAYIQTILKSDEERFAKSIIDGEVDCVFFGIRSSRPMYFTYTGADLFGRYNFVEMNEEATMLFFIRTP